MLPQFMSYQNLWVWIRIVTVVQTKAGLKKCKGLIFSWWCLELCHLFYFPKHIAIINASVIFTGFALCFFLTSVAWSHSNHVKIYKKLKPQVWAFCFACTLQVHDCSGRGFWTGLSHVQWSYCRFILLSFMDNALCVKSCKIHSILMYVWRGFVKITEFLKAYGILPLIMILRPLKRSSFEIQKFRSLLSTDSNC